MPISLSRRIPIVAPGAGKGQARGLKTIESLHTHGTPPVPEPGTGRGVDDLSDEGIAS